ncbi:MAG TPA: hypothetical protein VIH53_01905 [Gemmatimonadaceae bacterium]|jgi:hypothetical protein
MRLIHSRSYVAGVIAGLVACAPAATQTGSPNERVLATTETGIVRAHEEIASDSTITAAPDATFAALQAAYQDLGIEIKMMDPATRQIGNRRFTKMYEIGGVRLSKYVGCGSSETGPTADSYRITMSIVSRVTPTADGSRIDTQLAATAQDPGTSKGALSCTSLGGLEQRIHGLTAKHLGG